MAQSQGLTRSKTRYQRVQQVKPMQETLEMVALHYSPSDSLPSHTWDCKCTQLRISSRACSLSMAASSTTNPLGTSCPLCRPIVPSSATAMSPSLPSSFRIFTNRPVRTAWLQLASSARSNLCRPGSRVHPHRRLRN